MTADPDQSIFQSTPPCGGDATTSKCSCKGTYFNPRPLAGATVAFQHRVVFPPDFNPRPLAGATFGIKTLDPNGKISIHAPLRGRQMRNCIIMQKGEFQSTPPCGGDLWPSGVTGNITLFQSTPPCGGDSGRWIHSFLCSYFNPRPLAGATGILFDERHQRSFQSTPPCGGDAPVPDLPRDATGFQSTPPCGGDATGKGVPEIIRLFQSTPPCGGDVEST